MAIKSEIEKKNELMKRFGAHLKRVRTEKGISGSELAKLCFLEKQNINRIEKGGANVTITTLFKICEALEMNFEELFKGFK